MLLHSNRLHLVLTAPNQGTQTMANHNSAPRTRRRFTGRAFPASVALTEGILVSFFSSAY
jgi:hypothetical protein